ncbi:MAG: xylose isomerase-like barrel protein [Armatimonadetes bacterium]|nr:xylose isomerase-like barrel protein [Armatimonadota bacterium]
MKIGFRIPGKAREVSFEELCGWAVDTGFGSIDLASPDAEQIAAARAAGLEIGTIDLPVPALRGMLTADPEKQQSGLDAVKAAIDGTADAGCSRMFFVLLPEDVAQKRADSFAIWKETFPAVIAHAEARGVRLALEGWPGPAPHYPALGCTPEMWRAMFAAVPSASFGLNFDPSHLARIGIDWRRALDEFGDRVIHVHGKDTDMDPERLYEHGSLGPTFRKPVGFSESWWRYTIPGEGVVDWCRLIGRLEDFGFDGVVSVELEDYRYHETWALQADGLRRSREHLARWVR